MNDLHAVSLGSFSASLDADSLAAQRRQQTHIGRRQLATAQVLVAADVPLTSSQLIEKVKARMGEPCYSTKPAYTVRTDIHALKLSGFPIRYSRVPDRIGYYLVNVQAQVSDLARLMLRRVGWHPSDWQQIGVYATMTPVRKVAQLFRMRHAFMDRLRSRLRAEHPHSSESELATLVLRELADLREEIASE